MKNDTPQKAAPELLGVKRAAPEQALSDMLLISDDKVRKAPIAQSGLAASESRKYKNSSDEIQSHKNYNLATVIENAGFRKPQILANAE